MDAIHTFKLREVVVSSVHVDVASWLAEQVAEHAEGPELGPRDIWVYSTAEFDVLPLDRLPRPKLPDAAGVRALLTGAPRLQLTMRRCSQDWYSARFAQHHYLSNSLAPSSLCMLARLRELSDGEEPDFCAAGGGGDAVVGFVCSMVHPGKAAHREHRLVVLPDFQVLRARAYPRARHERWLTSLQRLRALCDLRGCPGAGPWVQDLWPVRRVPPPRGGADRVLLGHGAALLWQVSRQQRALEGQDEQWQVQPADAVSHPAADPEQQEPADLLARVRRRAEHRAARERGGRLRSAAA